jgi:hypothetical protein
MQQLSRDTVAAGGRHAEAEEVHADEEVLRRQAEGGESEGARAHGGGLSGLSRADHQMPAGVGGGEAAVAALLEPVQPIPVASCYSPRDCIPHTRYDERQVPHLREAEERRPSGWP